MYKLDDINPNLNVIFDGQKSGDGVGITLGLIDNINSVTNLTLNLMDDYGGLFEIDPTSNQIIVSDAALLSGVKTEDFTLSVSGSFDIENPDFDPNIVEDLNNPRYLNEELITENFSVFNIFKPDFGVEGLKVDPYGDSFDGSIKMDAVAGYFYDILIDGEKIATYDAPDKTSDNSEVEIYNVELNIDLSNLTHGSHQVEILGTASSGASLSAKNNFFLNRSFDPDASTYFNSFSAEVGYSIGFLAEPNSNNYAVLASGEVETVIQLETNGNISSAELTAQQLADFDDSLIKIEYYSDSTQIHVSNFLYLPNQAVEGLSLETGFLTEKAAEKIKDLIGSDNFRDMRGSGSHLVIKNGGGLEIVDSNGIAKQLFDNSVKITKALLSENENFVAIETISKLAEEDSDNNSDIYVLNLQTNEIILQSNVHSDQSGIEKSTICYLSGVDNSGQSFFDTPHGADPSSITLGSGITSDRNLFKYSNELGHAIQATLIGGRNPNNEIIDGSSYWADGTYPTGNDLFVSTNGQYLAWSQTTSIGEGPSIKLQNNYDLNIGLTGEFFGFNEPTDGNLSRGGKTKPYEKWQMFPSISSTGDKICFLLTENFYETASSRSDLFSSELVFMDKSSGQRVIDTGLILRPEISSDGNFVKYQKLHGGNLSWHLADIVSETVVHIETVEQNITLDEDITNLLIEAGFPRGYLLTGNSVASDDEVMLTPQIYNDNVVSVWSLASGGKWAPTIDRDLNPDVPFVVASRDVLPDGREFREFWYFDPKDGLSIILPDNLISADMSDESVAAVLSDTMPDFIGSSLNETAFGTPGENSMYARGGNDLILSGSGDDYLIGGSGEGDDYYNGGSGHDVITFTSSTSNMFINLAHGYASGDDTGEDKLKNIEELQSTFFDDIIIGHSQNNYINALSGNDFIYTFDGDDIVHLGDGDDFAELGGGNDQVYLGLGNNSASGGDGDDIFMHANGSDKIFGGDGFDELWIDAYSFLYSATSHWLISDDLSQNEILGIKLEGKSDIFFSDIELIHFSDKTIEVLSLENSLSSSEQVLIGDFLLEQSYLSKGSDTFYGGVNADYVETGGGDDRIMTNDGDDVVVVSGQGNSEVSTGLGDDKVVVTSDWSGTLLLKNGAGSNSLEIQSAVKNLSIDDEGGLLIRLVDGSEILTENYLELDETTNMNVVSNQGYKSLIFSNFTPGESEFDFGFGDLSYSVTQGSHQSDDRLFASNYQDNTSDELLYIVSGRDGNDELFAGGGNTYLYGGVGDDSFYLTASEQLTVVVGDKGSEGLFNGNGKLPTLSTQNTNYGDSVYLDWSRDEVTLSNPKEGYFRIEHAETGSVIDIYDVEGAYFLDGEGGLEYHALSTGRPITSDDFGKLAYEKNDVKFWVEHNDADYDGATTIAVVTTVTKTVTDPVTKQRISYEEPTVKWKGLATEADSFVFSDVTINVINVVQTDLTGVPIEDTTVYGTAGIDLIIGDEFDNLIFGGDDNDIIFGGAGNDEIYGEGGDDVLIGGVGKDVLYGDYHEDALKPAEELDSKGKIMNASELDGDDVIVGGAGVDKINSGEGQNVAASGDLSSVILNAELDEMHTFLDYDEDELPV